MVKNKFLFNFAASYIGGGYKRLYEYAKWFDRNDGAWFIVHPRCKLLVEEFPNNQFFIVEQLKFERLFNDCRYLKDISAEIGVPELYYSYGIPIYKKIGKINWFHLSNVMTLNCWNVPYPVFERMKVQYLGKKIKEHFSSADVISAESAFSLSLIDPLHSEKTFLSVNGSDDELLFQGIDFIKKSNVATILGTYRYKALGDAYHIFEMLNEQNSALELMIIGNEKEIPRYLRAKQNVIVTGMLKRDDAINALKKTKYYISTTHIENSYNAASEGIFMANESFISDIGPHRELLEGMPFEIIAIPNMDRHVLHLRKEHLTTKNLKTWNEVIVDMLKRSTDY